MNKDKIDKWLLNFNKKTFSGFYRGSCKYEKALLDTNEIALYIIKYLELLENSKYTKDALNNDAVDNIQEYKNKILENLSYVAYLPKFSKEYVKYDSKNKAILLNRNLKSEGRRICLFNILTHMIYDLPTKINEIKNVDFENNDKYKNFIYMLNETMCQFIAEDFNSTYLKKMNYKVVKKDEDIGNFDFASSFHFYEIFEPVVSNFCELLDDVFLNSLKKISVKNMQENVFLRIFEAINNSDYKEKLEKYISNLSNIYIGKKETLRTKSFLETLKNKKDNKIDLSDLYVDTMNLYVEIKKDIINNNQEKTK